MKDLLNYVKKANTTFEETPINATDAVILSWVSYIVFPEIDAEGITIGELTDGVLLSEQETFGKAYNPKRTKVLFDLLRKSKRFSCVKVLYPFEFTSDEEETQFAAVTLRIKQHEYFIAFRGTDPSYAGWRENFNCAYHYPVPSQVSAYEYADKIIGIFGKQTYYIGGHSKGGNLAVYASFMLNKEKQNMTKYVFDFDGQGFIFDIKKEKGYENIKKKIKKFVPQSSLVGMLLLPGSEYKIVKSRSVSVFQHDPFSWEVSDNGQIQELAERTKSSVRLEKACNKWIEEMTFEERKRMVEIIYRELYKLSAKDFTELNKTFFLQVFTILRLFGTMNDDDKEFFNKKVKRLFDLRRAEKQFLLK